MRLKLFFVLIVLLFFAFAFIACDEITDGEDDSNGTGTNHWTPQVSDTWQWQLSGEINTSYDVDVYDVDQAAELVSDFDFTINEECNAYDECDGLTLFIAAGKPVFNAEYDNRYVNNTSTRQTLCDEMNALGFRTLVLPLDLDDSFRYSCD